MCVQHNGYRHRILFFKEGSFLHRSNSFSRLFSCRRGPNHSLKITIATKQRSLESPPTDYSSEEFLRTATRKLTIDDLHQRALDTVLLSNEFWVRQIIFLLKLVVSFSSDSTEYSNESS